MRVVLGIDLGSSWCKAALYDPAGQLIAYNRVPSYAGPAGPGASAADLARWWGNIGDAVRPLAPVGRPDGIAFANRGYWGVFLDEQMRAIAADGPANQSREAVYAASGWGEGGPWARAYAPVLVAATCWLLRQRPALHALVRRVGALHDWLVWRLTGAWVTDPCNGPCGLAGWPEAALSLTGLPVSAFPTLLPAEATAGRLTVQAGEDLGLPAGIPVACSSHDGALANLGGDAWREGDALVTLGTNSVLRIVMGRPLEGWFGYPIPPGAYAWVRGVPGLAPRAEAAKQQGAEDYRAALVAVAGAVGELLAVAHACGLRPRQFQVTGGLSNVPIMRELLRQTLDGSVAWTDPEAGLRGAAMLAAVACGWYGDVPAAASAMRYQTDQRSGG